MRIAVCNMRFYFPLGIVTLLTVLLGAFIRIFEFEPNISVLAIGLASMTIIAYAFSIKFASENAPPFEGSVAYVFAGCALALVLSGCANGLVCLDGGFSISNCIKMRFDTEDMIVYVLVAPIFEEILLRGYLQRTLSVMTKVTVVQLFVQGAVFAVSHSGITNLPRMTLYFGAGVLLTSLAIGRGGLASSIGFHCVWNGWQHGVQKFSISGNDTYDLLQKSISFRNLVLGCVFLLVSWILTRFFRED